MPWIVLLIALAVGAFLVALGRALGGRGSLPRYTLSFAALWLLCAACLVAIYATQEFLEGLFATGHPGGPGRHLRLRRLVVDPGCARRRPRARGRVPRRPDGAPRGRRAAHGKDRSLAGPPAPRIVARSRLDVLLPALAPLADGWSGRGPPARS